ncbi:hypothetical protein D7B24_008830 [Verticillium nonalfalfae]|uniref:PH domain-containing protein n=1 Tax=Verticillium nonalfalfae TaxID=1051616 RepID=A0A3M9Y430_9PEZI|nr:uncharacterized protein D7B24_008830 [Verticillium nonalfalfae]RNJ55217.1 hypothetical protein D7B24_008830 [Verticillium nonalfalfae]
MAAVSQQLRPVLPERGTTIAIPTTAPPALISSDANQTRIRSRSMLDTYASPVNQNGSFEFDREVKSGHVQKRTQKTKTWKSIYLVLRPNALSLYKTDKEDKLRHKINLSDLTAVALLRDPKQKRKHVFGCFSPAKNYHFQAKDDNDAQKWVDLIRTYARIDEEEEELLLASPVAQRGSYLPPISNGSYADPALRERVTSSSPEPLDPPAPRFMSTDKRRPSNMLDSSGYSGNELASHSDFSDTEMQRLRGMSIEDLAGQSPQDSGVLSDSGLPDRPQMKHRNSSQVSGLNLEHDPDRVIWQGWLWFLRNKGGVRQWKRQWAVLRPRNFILYKDESEYTAQFLRPMSAVVDVVDIDPVSKTKSHCLQLITDEKSYRFCAPDEESLVLCLGAFKSLLAKRRELEARAAANASHATAIPAPVSTV